MSGLFSNPLNWKIVDTIQGQEGGYGISGGSNPNYTNAAVSYASPTGSNIQSNGSSTDLSPVNRSTGTQNTTVANQGTVQGASSSSPAYATNYNTGYSAPSSGGSTAPVAPVVDPALVKQFDTQRTNIGSTADEAAGISGRNYGGAITDYINSLNSSQQTIDNRRISNELGRRQGMSDIQGMVGRGIASGGVMLANRNATDSSAAGALARAYGNIGTREARGVGSQYAAGEQEADQLQAQFDTDEITGAQKLEDDRLDIIDKIAGEARTSISALKSAMIGASVPEQINLEDEIGKIRANVVGELKQYDTRLAEDRGEVSQMGRDAIMSGAADQSAAGIAASQPYEFTTEVPAQFQGGAGPIPGGLPIFTFGGQKKRK